MEWAVDPSLHSGECQEGPSSRQLTVLTLLMIPSHDDSAIAASGRRAIPASCTTRRNQRIGGWWIMVTDARAARLGEKGGPVETPRYNAVRPGWDFSARSGASAGLF